MLALAALVLSAPVPKADPLPPGPYFPTTVGFKWSVEQDGHRTEYAVSKVEDGPGGSKLVTVDFSTGGITLRPLWVIEVSESGLSVVASGGRMIRDSKRLERPEVWLKAGAKVGDSWETWLPSDPGSKVVRTLRGAGRVKTPAGEFHAVRVDEEVTTSIGETDRRAYWYSPGRGEVRVDRLDTGEAVRSLAEGGSNTGR
jgi:hypothetical protein